MREEGGRRNGVVMIKLGVITQMVIMYVFTGASVKGKKVANAQINEVS